jgi:hypothetical protein
MQSHAHQIQAILASLLTVPPRSSGIAAGGRAQASR